MTEQQFLEKVEEMLPNINELILTKAKKIIKSGCINMQEYENTFILPKIFITAIGKDISKTYKPLASCYRKEAENIEQFL